MMRWALLLLGLGSGIVLLVGAGLQGLPANSFGALPRGEVIAWVECALAAGALYAAAVWVVRYRAVPGWVLPVALGLGACGAVDGRGGAAGVVDRHLSLCVGRPGAGGGDQPVSLPAGRSGVGGAARSGAGAAEPVLDLSEREPGGDGADDLSSGGAGVVRAGGRHRVEHLDYEGRHARVRPGGHGARDGAAADCGAADDPGVDLGVESAGDLGVRQ